MLLTSLMLALVPVAIINPQCMRSLCVYLSHTTLAATYFIFMLKIRCLIVLYGIFQIYNIAFAKNALFKSFGIMIALAFPTP